MDEKEARRLAGEIAAHCSRRDGAKYGIKYCLSDGMVTMLVIYGYDLNYVMPDDGWNNTRYDVKKALGEMGIDLPTLPTP
jgi:hypothetical protein